MSDSHDIGRLFWYPIKIIPGTPLWHRADTYQGVWPYWWSKSWVIRITRARALVLGWWRKPSPDDDEEDLLLRPLGGRRIGEIHDKHICAPQTCGMRGHGVPVGLKPRGETKDYAAQ